MSSKYAAWNIETLLLIKLIDLQKHTHTHTYAQAEAQKETKTNEEIVKLDYHL